MDLERLKAQLDVTFYAEVNMQMHMLRALPPEERMAFARSLERFKQIWKLRDQYESAK